MSNSVKTILKSTLPPFHNKLNVVTVDSNFVRVSVQTAQVKLFIQCSL